MESARVKASARASSSDFASVLRQQAPRYLPYSQPTMIAIGQRLAASDLAHTGTEARTESRERVA